MPRRTIVVGIGGVGSWFTEGLVRILEFNDPGSVMILVDGDSYEPKNRQRQAFTQFGNKALVRASEIQPMFPRTSILAVDKWVVEKVERPADAQDDDDFSTKIAVMELLQEEDHVFALVDNVATRKLIFDAAKNFNNIDIYTAGNDEGYFASYYHYRREAGEEVTDHPSVWDEQYITPPDKNPGQMSCQERAEIEGATQFVCTNFLAAAALLTHYHRVTQLKESPTKHSEFYIDFAAEESLAVAFSRPSDAVMAAGEQELVTTNQQRSN